MATSVPAATEQARALALPVLLKAQPVLNVMAYAAPWGSHTLFDSAEYAWTRNAERCERWPQHCTPRGYTLARRLIPAAEACAQLHELGVRSVLTMGDSFARHAHMALLQWLRDDYVTGALDARHPNLNCTGTLPWDEPKVECRDEYDEDGFACQGTLRLRIKPPGAFTPLLLDNLADNDVVFLLAAGHTLAGHPPLVPEDVIQGDFPDGICRNATFRALVKDKLFWVGPHYRFSPNAATPTTARMHGQKSSPLPSSTSAGWRQNTTSSGRSSYHNSHVAATPRKARHDLRYRPLGPRGQPSQGTGDVPRASRPPPRPRLPHEDIMFMVAGPSSRSKSRCSDPCCMPYGLRDPRSRNRSRRSCMPARLRTCARLCSASAPRAARVHAQAAL